MYSVRLHAHIIVIALNGVALLHLDELFGEGASAVLTLSVAFCITGKEKVLTVH